MGVNNRAKRAAKAKQKAKQHSREQYDSHFHFDRDTAHQFAEAVAPEAVADADLRSLVKLRMEKRDAPSHRNAFARNAARYQQHAIDGLLKHVVGTLFHTGWTPDDIAQIARRRTSAELADYALQAAAASTRTFTPDAVAPAWLAQVDGVDDAPGCRAWADDQELAWDNARDAMIDLLTALASLPSVEPIMPAAGDWKPLVDEAQGVDDRILGKVRGLLAKAESTEFDEEAEALTAKAQDLMRTYSIEHALLTEQQEGNRERPEVRRIWIDAPYVDQKASLIDQVGSSNRCRCVFSRELGFITVIGFAADLDTVALLSTSLLFQASRAMRTEGTRRYRDGGSRTRSFRQSFLLAYAMRIGERLREASSETESRIDVEHNGKLLPVLASRDDDVADYTEQIFPSVVARSVHGSDLEGYGAGRSAADKAHIEIRDAIAES